MDSLPPNPYTALGVAKEATLSEIRSAYRKLVLKCHPDKVQDAQLKAIKQDEFQKVQQAYEILSDEPRRQQYNEQSKLVDLRKEMGGRNASARSNPFEYEVRNAEPRPNTFSRSTRDRETRDRDSRDARDSPKVYTATPPRSREDVMYDEPLRSSARKSANYKSSDRERKERERDRDEERMRKQQEEEDRLREEKVRARLEKESKRAGHSERKKNRDKEKRRGAEEKQTRASAAYVEEDHEDEYMTPPRSDKKSSRRPMEEDIRMASEPPRGLGVPLVSKWDEHKEFASQYMKAAQRKGKKDEERPSAAALRRSEPPSGPPPTMRYASSPPTYAASDDDSPRRSAARAARKSGESTRDRERSRDLKTPSKEKDRRRKSPTPLREIPIVEPPSPPPSGKKPPTLHSYGTAPPVSAYPTAANSSSRRDNVRSQTQEYPRLEKTPPPISRAQTFHGERGGRFKKTVDYDDDIPSPDRETPTMFAAHRSHSPEARPDLKRSQTSARYKVDNGRAVPMSVPPRAPNLQEMVDEVSRARGSAGRERSESPRGHASDRPPISRAESSNRSRGSRVRSSSQQAYYTPEAPEPMSRPSMNAREQSSYRSPNIRVAPQFDHVKYAPSYGPENVVYTARHPVDAYKRGASGDSHRDYSYPTHRSGRPEVYA